MIKSVEVSLYFDVRLKPVPENLAGYIFTYLDGTTRLSAYVKSDLIYFDIPQDDLSIILNRPVDDKTYFVCMPVKEYFDSIHSFCFEYSVGTKTFTLSITVDGKKQSQQEFLKSSFEQDYQRYFFSLGANTQNRAFGFFDLHENLIFTRLLNKEEKKQMNNYFKGKKKGNYIQFSGKEFMYRDLNSGHLVQNKEEFKPKYITSDKIHEKN